MTGTPTRPPDAVWNGAGTKATLDHGHKQRQGQHHHQRRRTTDHASQDIGQSFPAACTLSGGGRGPGSPVSHARILSCASRRPGGDPKSRNGRIAEPTRRSSHRCARDPAADRYPVSAEAGMVDVVVLGRGWSPLYGFRGVVHREAAPPTRGHPCGMGGMGARAGVDRSRSRSPDREPRAARSHPQRLLRRVLDRWLRPAEERPRSSPKRPRRPQAPKAPEAAPRPRDGWLPRTEGPATSWWP